MKRMPDPNHFSSIGWIIVGIAALCMAFNQIDDFVKRRQGRDGERTLMNVPLEVKAATEFVAKHLFDKHVEHNTSTHNEMFQTTRQIETKLREEFKEDVDALHEKTGHIAEDVAGLKAATVLQNQQLASIVATQNQILQRLPRKA